MTDRTTDALLALSELRRAQRRAEVAREDRHTFGAWRYWAMRAQSAQAERQGYRDAAQRFGD